MAVSRVLFSSKSTEWSTPQALFERLNAEFHFTLDVCASRENAKCPRYFDEALDGLAQPWQGESCWCNPPYGRDIGAWTAKALTTTLGTMPPTRVVMLLPARTDTKWWHRDVMQADELRFIAGRLHFGGAPSPAPFPSALAIFRSDAQARPAVRGYACK